MNPREPIFKLLSRSEWMAAEAAGRYSGSEVDGRDGFIHLSTGGQVRETAARHFAHETTLVLVAVDPASLGDTLRWEPSRGGALFPHVYGDIDLGAVLYAEDVPQAADGTHLFPDNLR